MVATSLVRRLTALLVASAVVGATLTTVAAPAAEASWSFPNIEIAKQAQSYKLGSWGGQCKVFGAVAVNAVLARHGISARVGGYGSPGGAYYGAYKNAGATLVAYKDVQPGDVIQTVNAKYKHSDHPPLSGLHTAIVVALTADPDIVVVRDSNYSSPGDERIREHTWDARAFASSRGSAVYVWRFGTTATAPWSASLVGQSSYLDAELSQPWRLDKAYAGQTGYLQFEMLNTGTKTWSATGTNPVNLGTAAPQDRESPLYVADKWTSPTRPAALTPATVNPGEVGTFTFPVRVPPGAGTLQEDFRLVAEGAEWFGPKLSREFVRQQWNAEYVGQSAWLDAEQTQSWDLTAAYPGQTGYLRFRVKNTGNNTWRFGGDHPVRLGTWGPQNRTSRFHVPGSWPSATRAAVLHTATVEPGQIGTFVFPIEVPTGEATVRERFRLVAEGMRWFGPGLAQDITIERLATKLRAEASADVVTYGETVDLSGTLRAQGSPLPNRPVTVMRRDAGSTKWVPRTTVTTDENGRVSLIRSPKTTAEYKLTYAGARTYAAGASAPVPVQVRTTVELRLSDETVPQGEPVVFAGAVAPDRANEPVLLQRRGDAGWVDVDRDRLSSASKYRFAFSVRASGDSRWRVVHPRSVDHLTGQSPVRALTVTTARARTLASS